MLCWIWIVNEQYISLVIATAEPLPSLVKDIDFGGGQLFHRPFDIRELKYFNKKEIRSLIDIAVDGTGIKFSKNDYSYIQEISQGHPFKAQFACSRIFEDKIFS